HYMHFVAQELREILAELGLRSVDELVGRTDLLTPSYKARKHPKARELNLNALLHQNEGERTKSIEQQHGLEHGFDLTELLPATHQAIERGVPFSGTFTIGNEQRNVGVITGSEITQQHGLKGLEPNTINVYTTGHAGQSLGAWIPQGLTLHHTGDANDYVGKGLSGGQIVVNAPNEARERDIIVGNVCFYGATSGSAYINGRAGERFCIRNSGVNVVVEGVGDHGLEYMTGGRVVILGDVGKNFGQGMSGGVSYIFPSDVEAFKAAHALNTLDFDAVTDAKEAEMLKQMLANHVTYTQSTKAQRILENFEEIG
ncbi:glutamate synthase subunit alpha, partial [Staphylococcus agnetis]|nr:glutamate synthase subunit alpha [Staphylococcus agnetis]